MKSMVLMTSICVNNINRMCSKSIIIVFKMNMTVMFELNLYTVLLNVLLIEFLKLLRLNCMKERLLSHSEVFFMMLK